MNSFLKELTEGLSPVEKEIKSHEKRIYLLEQKVTLLSNLFIQKAREEGVIFSLEDSKEN